MFKEQNKLLAKIVDLLTKGMPNRVRTIKFVTNTFSDVNMGTCKWDKGFPFCSDIEIHYPPGTDTELMQTIAHEVFHAFTSPDINFKMPIQSEEDRVKINELTADVCEAIAGNLLENNAEIHKLVLKITKVKPEPKKKKKKLTKKSK